MQRPGRRPSGWTRQRRRPPSPRRTTPPAGRIRQTGARPSAWSPSVSAWRYTPKISPLAPTSTKPRRQLSIPTTRRDAHPADHEVTVSDTASRTVVAGFTNRSPDRTLDLVRGGAVGHRCPAYRSGDPARCRRSGHRAGRRGHGGPAPSVCSLGAAAGDQRHDRPGGRRATYAGRPRRQLGRRGRRRRRRGHPHLRGGQGAERPVPGQPARPRRLRLAAGRRRRPAAPPGGRPGPGHGAGLRRHQRRHPRHHHPRGQAPAAAPGRRPGRGRPRGQGDRVGAAPGRDRGRLPPAAARPDRVPRPAVHPPVPASSWPRTASRSSTSPS